MQLPFVAWGVLADFLKNVAITSGPLVASQTGFVAWQRETIAFAFQFGSLILPTVVPAVAWVLTHRALSRATARASRGRGLNSAGYTCRLHGVPRGLERGDRRAALR